MNIVTRIAPITRRTAEPAIKAAREVAARLGVLRADLWNQYGGLRAWGGKATELAKTFKATAPPERYGVDFKGWERTTLQVLDDILMTHAAIRAAVEPKIEARYGKDAPELAMLKTTEFLEHPVLHRWVRNASSRGHTSVDHHIVLCHGSGATFNRRGKVTEVLFNGRKIPGTKRYEKIALSFRTGIANVDGYATVIFRDGVPFLHYPYTEGCQRCARREKDFANQAKAKAKACGCAERRKADKTYRCPDCAQQRERLKAHIEHARHECPVCKTRKARSDRRYLPAPGRSLEPVGVDKGFSEVFACSDGTMHGEGFGEAIAEFSDQAKRRNAERAKLRQRFKDTSNPKILINNLGSKKRNRQRARFDAKLKQIAGQAANEICRNHAHVVAEDLRAAIRGKDRGKRGNRIGAAWQKGLIREALQAAADRYGTTITNVNPAYTSQMDSRNNVLLGKRNGDRFIGYDGVVLQADINAAGNVLARKSDPWISLFTPYREVKRILQARTVAFCIANGIEPPKESANNQRNRQRARGAAQGGKNARKRTFRANQAITSPSSSRPFVAFAVG